VFLGWGPRARWIFVRRGGAKKKPGQSVRRPVSGGKRASTGRWEGGRDRGRKGGAGGGRSGGRKNRKGGGGPGPKWENGRPAVGAGFPYPAAAGGGATQGGVFHRPGLKGKLSIPGGLFLEGVGGTPPRGRAVTPPPTLFWPGRNGGLRALREGFKKKQIPDIRWRGLPPPKPGGARPGKGRPAILFPATGPRPGRRGAVWGA